MITKKIILGLIAGALCSTMLLSAASPSKSKKNLSWDENAKLEKADYYYLKALEYYNTDSFGNLHRVIERAYELDGDDNEISSMNAMFNLMILDESDPEFENNYNRVIAGYKANPSNLIMADFAGNIAMKLRRFGDAAAMAEKLYASYPNNNEFALRLANIYTINAYMGDTTAFKDAKRLFDKLQNAYGRNLGLSSNKIRSYDMLGDTAAIYDELKALTTELSEDPTVYHYAGTIYDHMGQDSMAMVCYRRAREVDPGYISASADLARIYLKQNDTETFKSEAFRTLSTDEIEDNDGLSLLQDYLYVLSLDSLTVEQERPYIKAISEANFNNASVHGIIGIHYITRQAQADGLDELETAYTIDNTNQATINFYVSTLYMDGQKEKALDVLLDASKRMNNSDYAIKASTVMRELKRDKEALDMLRGFPIDSINDKSKKASLQTAIGDIYWGLDDLDSAFVCYEKAIALDNESYTAYNNAAYMMATHDRDLDQALKYARIAYLGSPSTATFLDTYAWVYFKRKEYDSAKKYIDRAIESMLNSIGSSDSSASDYDAEPDGSMFDEPSEDDAKLTLVDKAIKAKDSIEKDILDHAGDIYFMNGEPKDALRFWEAALTHDPEDKLLQRKVKNKTYFFE